MQFWRGPFTDGIRDAANAWADEIKILMVAQGFEQGKSTPCAYVRKARELKVALHGDDFVVVAEDPALLRTD